MVSINVSIEKGPLYDLRRRYTAHRKNFLNKKKGWKPTYSFYEFETFDDFIEAGLKMIKEITAEAVNDNPVDGLESIDVLVERGGYMRPARGQHNVNESTEKKAIFLVSADHLFLDPYYIYRGDLAEYADNFSEASKFELKDTMQHELRHQSDLYFVKHSCFLRRLLGKIFPQEFLTRHASRYCYNYILDLRTEGFANFNSTVRVYETEKDYDHFKQLMSDEGASLRAEGFLTNLQRQTETIDKVFSFFSDKTLVNSYDIYNQVEVGQHYSPHEREDPNPLGLPVTFSPYVQGHYLFHVIALAELKKLKEKKGEYKGFESLFRRVFTVSGVQEDTLRKAKKQKSLSEFFDLYYRSARELELDNKHIIIEKCHVEPLLEFEKHPIQKYKALRSNKAS